MFVWRLDIDNPVRWPSKLCTLLVKLSPRVQRTNIFLSLSILIAGAIRIEQDCPLAEANFIRFLGFLQLGIAVATFFYFFIVPAKSRQSEFFVCLLLSGVIDLLSLALVALGGYSSSRASSLEALTTNCASQRNYPAGISVTESTNAETTGKIAGSVIGGLVVIFCIGVYLAWQSRRPPRVCKPMLDVLGFLWSRVAAVYVHFCRLATVEPVHLAKALGMFALLAMWTGFNAMYLSQLWYERRQLIEASSGADQDTDWGFGQVNALVVWASLLYDVSVELAGRACILVKDLPVLTTGQSIEPFPSSRWISNAGRPLEAFEPDSDKSAAVSPSLAARGHGAFCPIISS